MHCMGTNARTELVQLLRDAGADPNMRDMVGQTLLTLPASVVVGPSYLAGS